MTNLSLEPTQASQPAQESQEIQFGQILAMLWRGRWIILTCVLLSGVAGYLYVSNRGTIWRASSRVYVERKGPTSVAAEQVLLGLGTQNFVNTQAELMISRDILIETLQKFRAESPTPQIFGEVPVNEVSWLRGNIKVSVGRKDDIITVSLDSKFLDEACAMVNHLADSY